MAMFGKKGGKGEKATPKAAAKGASPKQPKQPKQPKPLVPPDTYTLFLGLSALFLLAAATVLGVNYFWYQSVEPAVIPMTWAK